MKILVLGGFGYLGCRICRKLVENGHKVDVVDNFFHGQQAQITGLLPYVNYIGKDVFDYNYDLNKYDVVLPLAAIVGAGACDKYPELAQKLNYDFIQDLISKVEVPLVIFPNTNSSYGQNKDGVCTEESEFNPISLYAETKCNAERVVLTYKNSICLRLATVFSLSDRSRLDLLVNNWVYQAFFKKELQVYEPHFRRNFIHIDDIADCFLFLINNAYSKNLCGQVFNVGNDSLNMTKGELAEAIAEKTECKVSFCDDKEDSDKRDYIVSSQKIYGIGWEPKKTLEDGIQELKTFFSTFPTNHDHLLKTMFNYAV